MEILIAYTDYSTKTVKVITMAMLIYLYELFSFSFCTKHVDQLTIINIHVEKFLEILV